IAVVAWFLWTRRDTSANSAAVPPTAPYAPAYDPAAPAAPYAPAYDPAAPASPYAPAYSPAAPAAPTAPLSRPRDPRRRGPILFWFALALIALSLGVLGTVDLAGVAVAPSAYPALAMAISATMLVLGAFWGRAGGILFIALVSAVTTVG